MKTILLRAALALSLAFGVAACSADQLAKFHKIEDAITSASISPRTVVLGIQAFDVAKVAATGYLRLVRCSATSGPVCRDPVITAKIAGPIADGTVARNNLKAWVRANPNGTADETIYQKMTDATSAIEGAITIYTNATK